MADHTHDPEDIDLVDLYYTYNPNEAEFIKDMLQDNDIVAFIRDLEPAQFPFSVGKHAQVRVVVDDERLADAVSIIRAAIADDAITDEGGFLFEGDEE